MKKKLLGLTLSAAIAVSGFTPILAEESVTISGGTVYVKAGEEFVMPVSAVNGENIKGFTLKLSYDSKYITPVKDSLSNKGDMAVQAIQFDDSIIISADNVNTKELGEEVFTYKFKASEALKDEITTGITLNIGNMEGEDISKVNISNGIVKINSVPEEPSPSPETSEPPAPSTSPEPSESPEPSQEPIPSETPEQSPEPTEKSEQNISIAKIPDKQYGDAPFSLEVTSNEKAALNELTYASSDESVATVNSDGTVTINGAGICEITAFAAENETHKAAETKTTLTVNKKVLSVYPNDLSITYGEALPQNLIAYEGFVNAEDEDELAKQVIISGLPETVTPGVYKLTLSGINSDNYKISYLDGTLTINKKTIAVESLSVYDKAADGNTSAVINPLSASLSGVNAGDDVKLNLSAATAEFAQAEVGDNISVNISNLSLTGADAGKYELASSEFTTAASIKESISAAEMAATINSIDNIAKDQHKIILPYVGSGFTASIATTSNADIISSDGDIGYIDEDTEVTLTLAISKDEDTATTNPITVTVPASTKYTITQGDMACSLSGTGTYYKGQKATVSVANGYKVRAWYINDTKISVNDTSYSFTVEEDSIVWADTYQHNGGSLAANVVSKVTSNTSASKKVIAGTTIELDTATNGATIYYTTDGSTPTTSSKKYTGGIDIDESMVIKAIAVKNGMNNSQVSTFNYTIRYAETELKNNANKIKYMAAYADNTFRPDQAATRYEVINALNELLDIEEIDNGKTFSDVDSDHFDVVSKFANVGIISGYGNGTFGGNRSITRAEFVTLLTKAWNFDESNAVRSAFNDTDNHWAADIINTFASKGYVSGYPDGGFHPDDKVTRAEVVSVINRMVGTKAIASSQKYVDLAPTHWAYSQIMAVVA